MSCIAIIVAAGSGSRFGNLAKQFIEIEGRSLLHYAVMPFLKSTCVDEVQVVVSAANETLARRSLAADAASACVNIVPLGGATRSQSVRNALEHCHENDWALVHDGARPCLSHQSIDKLFAHAKPHGALLALPLTDALKQVHDDKVIASLPRQSYWRAQTPQIFRVGILREALAAYPDSEDETQAMSCAGYAVRVVRGDPRNIKITYAEDLPLITQLLLSNET